MNRVCWTKTRLQEGRENFLCPFFDSPAMLSKILDPLLTLAYPQACQICRNSVEHFSDGAACENCWKNTRVFSGAETLCRKCGRFFSENASDFETFCHQCDAHFYDAARAAGLYEKGLQASILNLKREAFVAARLKKIFVSAFEKSGFQNATKMIPVPLSKKRFIERGFNQAAVLAKILAAETGIEPDENSLTRKIHTPLHRAGMDTKARELSVKNAFEITRPKLIAGHRILLIDDVFTSGATASACAKILKKNGTKEVYVFTVARAF